MTTATEHAEELSNAFGFLRLEEVGMLKDIVRLLPPDPTIINIGAGVGTSGLCILEARPDTRLVTIDITCGVDPRGGLGNEKVAMDKAGFPAERYRQICGDSSTVGRNWLKESYGEKFNPEMVFIDGNHSYEGCKADIEAWLPHVTEIMAFHDYKSDNWPAVCKAVEEYFDPDKALGLEFSVIAFDVKDRK